jgi:hypothetical protein
MAIFRAECILLSERARFDVCSADVNLLAFIKPLTIWGGKGQRECQTAETIELNLMRGGQEISILDAQNGLAFRTKESMCVDVRGR